MAMILENLRSLLLSLNLLLAKRGVLAFAKVKQ